MATEVLWIQQSAVTYSASEDRKLFPAIWATEGVIHGLAVTAGAGRSVDVAVGRAAIDDEAGGYYLAFLDAVANVSLAANSTGSTRTDLIYLVVNTTTGIPTVAATTGSTTAPSHAVKLANVNVPNGASSISSSAIVTAGVRVDIRARGTASDSPTVPGSPATPYLKKDVNDTSTGGLTLASLTTTGAATIGGNATVAGTFRSTGVAAFPVGYTDSNNILQKPAHFQVYQHTASNSFTATAAVAWKKFLFTAEANSYNDYNAVTPSAGAIIAPVRGLYAVSSTIFFNGGTPDRTIRIAIAGGGTGTFFASQEGRTNSDGNCQLSVSALVVVSANAEISTQWMRASAFAVSAPASTAQYPQQMWAALIHAY